MKGSKKKGRKEERKEKGGRWGEGATKDGEIDGAKEEGKERKE